MLAPDVPSPTDLRVLAEAREWERTAMEKRPWRVEFFERFAQELLTLDSPVTRLLDLGSGPGFLAEHLLRKLPEAHMVLLDFSAAMNHLARERLGPLVNRALLVERNFREEGWFAGLGPFDAVVTNQAVHELRHKRYAGKLHSQVRAVLRQGGSYLVCDHFLGSDGMSNDQLYMTANEQKQAIASAGFTCVREVLLKSGMVLHHAT